MAADQRDAGDLFAGADTTDAYEQAFNDGRQTGVQQGLAEGRLLGISKGIELSLETGYYRGVCATWMMIVDSHGNAQFSPRVRQTLLSCISLLDRFSAIQPSDQELQDTLDKIRAKMRMLGIQTKIRHAYHPDLILASSKTPSSPTAGTNKGVYF